ncbi:siderophore-iron reductase FhuF [Pseudoalteromonas sp. OOF1S-7]|uniref:siderophore-iron reductase FhuF n=1 Tax=Pseudoalteromonas sp. OOF1S-7 TaxID=2917757 RepID=UPI001EF3FA92|nr:siderophore-iron reductase FhuF [Pseudoalteromonas sp. OOF1S-7]MCG7536992.1 siderophore-iron reductase FhuF [Pseudoalteromonas sp. OOF1S-7]
MSQSPDLPTLAQQFAEVTALKSAIRSWAQNEGIEQPRAQASTWHMRYCVRVLPTVLLSHSVLNRGLPVAAQHVQLCLATQRLMLQTCGQPFAPASCARVKYHPLIFAHFAPLHAFLSSEFCIPERVLWSNLVFRLRHISTTIASVLPDASGLQQDIRTLLHRHCWQDQPNPLFKAQRNEYLASGKRVRGECCLLHAHPHKDYCGDCPKRPEFMAARKTARKQIDCRTKSFSQ